MAESTIPFLTGRVLSTDAVTDITAGTNVSALTSAETNAKNRRWKLTDATNCANMPRNYYWAIVIVENSDGVADAYVSINAGDDPATTTAYRWVPAGMIAEFTRTPSIIGPEPMSVMLDAASATACIVTERSYI